MGYSGPIIRTNTGDAVTVTRVGADASSGAGGRMIRSGGVTVARSSETPLPRFFEGIEPSYQVTLGASAGRTIRRELGAGDVRRARVETGGFLFCDPRDMSLIVLATGPGPGALLSRSRVEFSFEEVDAVKKLAPHLALCGDYHLHPTGDTLPSDTDLAAWLAGARLTRSHWIGVIFGPAPDIWSEPPFAAYITLRNGELPFCEPVRVKEL
jgi:proteasome lid subunit RPN8/RPN11